MIEKDKLQSINIGGLVSAIWKLAENMKASAGSFLGLLDVPASYAGQAKKFVKVNTGENSLEFISKATGVEVTTGTDDEKPVTPKALADSATSATTDTPLDADVFKFWDIADGVWRKIIWANIKATLKTYFDTLYVTTGTVVDFAGSSAPAGWLICNGATISQATYAALYAIIGHTYGADPGGGNFILPDCRGKATVGYKSADSNFGALGNVAAGEKTHQLSVAELAAHHHRMSYNGSSGSNPTNYSPGINSTITYYATSEDTGGDTAHNNIQPSIVFNKIIKY